MIKKFKMFESISAEDIKYKSNLTWYNEHPKIYSKEEEEGLLKELQYHEKRIEKVKEIAKLKAIKNDSVDKKIDPYGEEDWGDDDYYDEDADYLVRMKMDKMIIRLIDILKERIKILRSFK